MTSAQTISTLNKLLSPDLFLKDYTHIWQIYHKNAEHIIAFTNVILKSYYDAIHQSMKLKPDSMIYLYLFHSYIISDLSNHKLSNQ